MESENKPGMGRRAASVAGRGGKHVANYFGRWIILPATVASIIVVAGLHVLTGKFPWTGTIDPSKVEMSPVQIEQVELDCGLRLGWEDGQTDEERFFSLVAAYNRSKIMKTGFCDIARKFWTLRAENHPVWNWEYRPYKEADKVSSDWTPDQLAQYNKLKSSFQDYLKDPAKQQQAYPWLACVFAYQRTTYPGLLPWPDSRLDTTARLVHTSASGAKYYCPK